MPALDKRITSPVGRIFAGPLFAGSLFTAHILVLITMLGLSVSGTAFGRPAGESAPLPLAAVSGQQNKGTESATSENVALPVCKLAPGDPPRLAEEPCRPAPPKQPRRAVPQIISRMPAQPSTAAAGTNQGYKPLPPVGISALPSPYLLPGPLPVPACDKTGCRDAAGVRHNGGIGNATLTPNGRLCQKNGVFLNCS